MSFAQTRPVDLASFCPAAVAQAFVEAYRRADTGTLQGLCGPGATARYVPAWTSGSVPIADAIKAWARYPAAFADFDMPITAVIEDVPQRRAVVATLNKGIHIGDVDGIPARGRTLACPHLFVIRLDGNGLIGDVEVWCDQLSLYHQLGLPAGFTVERTP
jgi:hypothetical protein